MQVKDIKPNPDNPRFIKDDKFAKLVQSLKEFPEMATVRPVVINEDNVILGGNMRYKAMIEAGWDDIPVTKVKGWTKEQEREFIIKDNVSGGEWDWDVLANEWDTDQLEAWGLDLPESLNDEEVVEDEAPELSSEPPISKLGEVYQLGRHRVMCGDSTKDLVTLMDNGTADMLLTDPPYGIDYEGGSKKRDKIENDALGVYDFYLDFLQSARLYCKKGACAYIWHASTETHNAIRAFIDAGWQYKQYIVWVKNNATFGRQDYHWRHEPCIYGWGDGSHTWHGDRKQDTVWEIDRPSTSEEHPTMKPIALCAKSINNSSKSGDTVLDLFLGSGSTLIACEQTDRTCYGMELDPKYVDVIRKRYVKFTNNNELPDNWEELTSCLNAQTVAT